MNNAPTLDVAVANTAPRTRVTGAARARARTTDPGDSLLDLHERLLGSPDVALLMQRFLGWARAYGLSDDVLFMSANATDHEPLKLRQKRQHTVTFELTLDSTHLGTLALMRRGRFSAEELPFVQQALTCLSRHLKMALDLQAYRRLAMHDGLTGLLNRQSLDTRLAEELSRAQRHATALSLMLIDVDRFKELNDSLGHLSGDHTLRVLADIFSAVTRESDLVFRYGGDEFAILLPSTDLAAAHSTADRIRRRLTSLPAAAFSVSEDDADFRPDISIGIAQHRGADAAADLLRRADTHLYQAKAQGRGRVCTQLT